MNSEDVVRAEFHMRIACWLRKLKPVQNVQNIYEKNWLIFKSRLIPLYRFPFIEMTMSSLFVAAIINLKE